MSIATHPCEDSSSKRERPRRRRTGPWPDRVHGDAEFAEFGGKAQCEERHVVLGHGVRHVPFEPERVQRDGRRVHENVRVGGFLQVGNSELGARRERSMMNDERRVLTRERYRVH